MMGETSRKVGFLQELVIVAAAPIIAFFLFRNIISRLDPDAGQKEESQKKAIAAKEKLNAIFRRQNNSSDSDLSESDRRTRKENLVLNQYEQTIAMEVIEPNEIPVTFNDIGGHGDIIEELKEAVIYPLTMPELYAGSSSLLSAPSGVLLYGPPGCGKTMLAKALARESGACFINLHISTVTEKWYGDSNKLVSAVFSLARKLQPCIVFIDEIDAVLGQRRSGEHEASGMVKAEFMTQWDGLTSTSSTGTPQRICVLGATNRIQDIDEAILRRMPKKFAISLPTAFQRRGIFTLILRDSKVDAGDFDLDYLVRVSAGMSGSDIKDACRDAVMGPMREYIRGRAASGGLRGGVDARDVRGVRTSDFFSTKGDVNQIRDAHNRTLAAQDIQDLMKSVDDAAERRSDGASSRSRPRGRESSEEEGSSAEEDDFRDSAYQESVKQGKSSR